MKWNIIVRSVFSVLLFALSPSCRAAILTNTGFETFALQEDRAASPGVVSGYIATGWFDNSYWCNTTMTYAKDATVKHTGGFSQKLSLTSTDSCVQFARGVTLTTGHSYVAKLWMKASAPTKVTFKIRGNGDVANPTMHDYITKTVVVDTNWQQVTIGGNVTLAAGRTTEACFFMIEYGWTTETTFRGLGGNLWLDDVTMFDTTVPLRTSAQNLVSNSGSMEGAYVAPGRTNGGLIAGLLAPGWYDNTSYWQTTTSSTYSQETATQHSGTGCQKIVHTAATLQFATKLTPPSGRMYRVGVWLKSAAALPVTVSIQAPSTSKTYATQQVTLGSAWQEVTLCAVPGGEELALTVATDSLGTLYVDDVSFVDVSPTLPENAVSDEFFGMHFAIGATNVTTWPVTPVGTWRFWDCGTSWAALQPTAPATNNQANRRNTANWSSSVLTYTDSLVNAAVAHNTVPIMVLGMTPGWATSYRGPAYYFKEASGLSPAPGVPTNLDYWRDYVWVLGTRYKGKIHHWEIWNEPNDPYFFSGASTGTYPDAASTQTIPLATKAQQMVILAQAAREILKAIDPANEIIAPSPVGSTSKFLDAFLTAGGAAYCDIFGYHLYTDTFGDIPESTIQRLGEVRQSLVNNSVYDKPVWITEQGYFGNGTTQATLPTETAKAFVARAFLLDWAFGAEGRLQWYRWESGNGSAAYVLPLTTQSATPALNNNTLTPAGTAHAKIGDWLKGGVVMKAIDRDASGIWHIRIERPYTNGLYIGQILWKEDTTGLYSIPSTWGTATYTRKRLLDGSLSSVSLTVGGVVSVAITPILLETVAP